MLFNDDDENDVDDDDAGNYYSKGLRNVVQGLIAFQSHIDIRFAMCALIEFEIFSRWKLSF